MMTAERIAPLAYPTLNKPVAAAVACLPLLATILIFGMKASNAQKYLWIIREDGPVEWLTALAYVAASVIAIVVAFRIRRESWVLFALYLVFAAGLFVIAGEEASWGQRIFDYGTPEAVAQINQKNEFNLHNMKGFPLHSAFIFIGLYGAFARLLLTPLLRDRAPRVLELLTAPTLLMLYFLLPALLYIYYELVPHLYAIPQGMSVAEFLKPQMVSGKEQEPFELLLGMGFLSFTLYVLWATTADRVSRRYR
ncbi:hypothetical protein [Tropicimonas isoalkanivorans]|uniref:Uncharacterized protein n=1 Tax=Tropicimonas isoalkanivorans TaxID=441112 RepID=A0A1I1LIS9_9RHOB|nr:hypothetical protein [Tropicimonas isoalkanivorans]SFC72462.1 hypothetical protein SAMN04488094_108125 [Tropicimonas isoalkanivorans]